MLDLAAHASASQAYDYWNKRFYCAPAHHSGFIVCCANVCSGVYAVYRVSFTLCLFFAFLMLCTISTTKFGARVHRGFWFLKVFVLVSLLICTVFVDNSAMQAYREVARFTSWLFLLMQILLLIDFAYNANSWLVEWDERSDNEGMCTWKMAILGGAVTLYAISITLWVLEANFFGKDGCGPQQALIAFTIILTIGLSILSCTRIAPHGTLLTSAFVTAYASYLCYSALASHPNQQCNPFADRSENSVSDTLVGSCILAISLFSIGMSAWSATGSKEAMVGKATSGSSDLPTSLVSGGSSTRDPDAGLVAAASSDTDQEVEPESWWYYHLMMVVCSFYMAMFVTDWSTQPIDQVRSGAHQQVSYETFWVKTIAQWSCILMYGWTLLAPYLLRDVRDFGIDFDFD